MQIRFLVALVAVAWRGTDPEWPVAGPMPDEPGHASGTKYNAVGQGTKSFRPVEPMPWGDVNRRVAPPAASPPVSPDATPKVPEM